jgi:hypothetical protein
MANYIGAARSSAVLAAVADNVCSFTRPKLSFAVSTNITENWRLRQRASE